MRETPASDTKTQEIEIDFFRIEDAPGIARLFREVYGTGYPIRTYYLPDGDNRGECRRSHHLQRGTDTLWRSRWP